MTLPSDVNEGIKLTQKELSALVKSHESPEGFASQFTLTGLDAHITINACYTGGSGQHRAWKYLYYLTINGRKFGGHDRRDSFVAWAINKIKEVAPQQEQPTKAVTHESGTGAWLLTESRSLNTNCDTQSIRQNSNALEVASPESSTAQTGKSGTDTTASVEVPEESRSPFVCPINASECDYPSCAIAGSPFVTEACVAEQMRVKFAGERAEAVPAQSLPSPVSVDSNSDTPLTAMTSPAIPLESLAKYSDEGENGWNAWGRADIARKMNRIAAGGYNSVEKLIEVAEEVACR